LTLSYTNFIVLRIYAEALDRLRVRLNMYLVIITTNQLLFDWTVFPASYLKLCHQRISDMVQFTFKKHILVNILVQ